jgi:hypothetical protein
VHEIVVQLRKALTTNEREKEMRCVVILEDLLTHCFPLINEACNDRLFCEALVGSCLYFKHLKSVTRSEIRERICGMFLYWHLKFGADPNYVYEQYFERLKR